MARQEPSLLCLAQGHGLTQVTETKLSYRKPSTVHPRKSYGPALGNSQDRAWVQGWKAPVHSFCIDASFTDVSAEWASLVVKTCVRYS